MKIFRSQVKVYPTPQKKIGLNFHQKKYIGLTTILEIEVHDDIDIVNRLEHRIYLILYSGVRLLPPDHGTL